MKFNREKIIQTLHEEIPNHKLDDFLREQIASGIRIAIVVQRGNDNYGSIYTVITEKLETVSIYTW